MKANRQVKNKAICLICAFVVAASAPGTLSACALMMSTTRHGTFVGRTMEWFGPIKPKIAIYPRNFSDGDSRSSKKWVSKFGVVTIDDSESNGQVVVTDGINEKGLTAHVLVQEDAIMPTPDNHKSSVDFAIWVRYVLANNASVAEALKDLESYQIVLREAEYNGLKIKVAQHYALMDASGDSAIIEFNNGKMDVFHGPQYNVMTNAPNLPSQLKHLQNIKSAKRLYSVANLPGGADAMNRFVRGSFYLETMPRADSPARAAAYMEEAIDAMSVPAFDLDKVPRGALDAFHDQLASRLTGLPPAMLADAWEGRWRVVYDLKNMNLYFTETDTGAKVYLRLNGLDYSAETVRIIDLKNVKSDFDLPETPTK